MPDEPTPHTAESYNAAYLAALTDELAGATQRASFIQDAELQKAADAQVKDISAEISRVTGGKSKPSAAPSSPSA